MPLERAVAVLSVLVLWSLGACVPRELPPRPEAGELTVGDLRYRAETQLLEIDPPRLRTVVTVTNTGAQERQVTWPDACVVSLLAYREADRVGEPAWDQRREAVCAMVLVQLTLPAGASEEYDTEVGIPEILGDSLPAGRYYLAALLRPGGEMVEVPAGEAVLGTWHQRGDPASPPGGVTRGPPGAAEPVRAEAELATTAVTVHFTRNERQEPVVREVAPTRAVLRVALEEQLRGPTAAERAAGFTSWFSGETASKLNRVVIDDAGRAVVDFGDLAQVIPGASSAAGSEMLLGELNVRSVEYRMEGSCDRFWNWLQRGCEVVARPAQ